MFESLETQTHRHSGKRLSAKREGEKEQQRLLCVRSGAGDLEQTGWEKANPRLRIQAPARAKVNGGGSIGSQARGNMTNRPTLTTDKDVFCLSVFARKSLTV